LCFVIASEAKQSLSQAFCSWFFLIASKAKQSLFTRLHELFFPHPRFADPPPQVEEGLGSVIASRFVKRRGNLPFIFRKIEIASQKSSQ
jgi:hypothetical protein